jgi:hypothetical protein
MLIIQIDPSGRGGHARTSWDRDAQDRLGSLAASFKKKDDTAGIHLCAVVEAEMAKAASKESDCDCVGRFYLALVLSRIADGADQELAHLLLPQIQEMMAESRRRMQIELLERETDT